MAAGIAVGLGSLGAGVAVAAVGRAAMGALGEKPEHGRRALILLGLAEGIAINGLIVALMILAKVWMNIWVVGAAAICAAVALAGVKARVAEGRGEMLAALDELAAREDVRVLAVEEASAELAREAIDRLKLDPRAPLVVELPGIQGPAEGRRTALDLVRQALGIRL
jgi:V/A-type H+-transporting ATPase subunit K